MRNIIIFTSIILILGCIGQGNEPASVTVSNIPQDVASVEYAQYVVFKTELSKCLSLNESWPKVDGEMRIIDHDSPIESLTYWVDRNNGTIMKVTRQVFYNNCLLSDSRAEEVHFCCKCQNGSHLSSTCQHYIGYTRCRT